MILSDKSCPGSPFPCSYNGQCDHTTGQCICNEGHQGFDCSGNSKYSNVANINASCLEASSRFYREVMNWKIMSIWCDLFRQTWFPD